MFVFPPEKFLGTGPLKNFLTDFVCMCTGTFYLDFRSRTWSLYLLHVIKSYPVYFWLSRFLTLSDHLKCCQFYEMISNLVSSVMWLAFFNRDRCTWKPLCSTSRPVCSTWILTTPARFDKIDYISVLWCFIRTLSILCDLNDDYYKRVLKISVFWRLV
jgi:hypothetical protein